MLTVIGIKLAVCICVLFGFLICYTFHRIRIPIPYSAISVLVGILISYLAQNVKLIGKSSEYEIFDITLIEYFRFFFPIIIFKLAYCVDLQLFYETLYQTLIISILGFFGTMMFIGSTMVLLQTDWNFLLAMQIGIHSTTIYPLDVIKYLKGMGTFTKTLIVLLESETMFHLITYIMFNILLDMYSNGVCVKWYQIVCIILRCIILDIVVGLLIGSVACYLQRLFCFDLVMLWLLNLIIAVATFNVVVVYCGSVGCIAVLIVGIKMGGERKNLPDDYHKAILSQWECVVVALTTLMSFNIGLMLLEGFSHFSWLKFLYGLLHYLLAYVARLVVFLAIKPLLNLFGNGISASNLLICVWGGLRLRLNVSIIYLYVQEVEFTKTYQSFMPEVAYFNLYLYTLSAFINGTILPTLCECVSFSETSLARNVNINNCIMYIYAKKHQALSILKKDRLIADINWAIVKEKTILKAPYEEPFIPNRIDFNYYLDYEITPYPTKIESSPRYFANSEILREERVKVLNYRKKFYSQQLQKGLISIDVYNVLIQIDNASMDTCEVLYDFEKFYQKQRNEWFLKRAVRAILNVFSSKNARFRPPTGYFRRKAYRFILSKTYKVIKYLIIISHIVFLIWRLYYGAKLMNVIIDYEFNLLLFCIHFCFIFLNICQIIVIIMGNSWRSVCRDGIQGYFRKICNLLLFLQTVTNVTYSITVGLNTLLLTYSKKILMRKIFLGIIMAFNFIRLLEILSFLQLYSVRILLNSLNSTLDRNRTLTYEVGAIYSRCDQEIIEDLSHLIQNVSIRKLLDEKLRKDLEIVQQYIINVYMERPWIVTTFQTKQAIQCILNGMIQAISDLKLAGWLDDIEFFNLNNSIMDKYKAAALIEIVQPSSARVILREVSWVTHQTVDYLFDNCKIVTFNEGEKVASLGKVSDGIFILFSGVLLMDYQPTNSVLTRLNKIGCLPTVEYISDFRFNTHYLEHILPGHCVGELSTLTERPYSCNIYATTTSQALYISRRSMKKAFEKFKNNIRGLENGIWKRFSIIIGLNILKKLPSYRFKYNDEIRYCLERSFVPNLDNYSSFVVSDLMEDIILIEGMAYDAFTKQEYKAPCYIPRFVKKLTLVESKQVLGIKIIRTKLLVIPIEGVDEYEALNNEKEFEIEETASSECLQHLASARDKKYSEEQKKNVFIK